MNLLSPKTIEERVIMLLQGGSMTAGDILAKIKKDRPKTTKQALYSALRKMKVEEIVAIHGKLISLSHVWVVKMAEIFNSAKRIYAREVISDDGFLNLEEGDKIVYNFKSAESTDIFWGHAFALLAHATNSKVPLILYNPHEWFFLARKDSERLLFDEIKNIPRQIFLITDHNDPLDKQTAREFDGKMSQYHMLSENQFPKENYYLNIFDDLIIEVWLDEKVAEKIDQFYKANKTIDENNLAELRRIVKERGRNKMKISRNKKRAEKLRAKFEKYFYKIDTKKTII
ncbi:MAG: hypothetical protein US50_C0004G0016 [Candidatus Nomurabacteria bacterium GW2011_GWB1_37_5]|uniref:Uncharacterized protein n=1 Tax=Candidatus Nomurabacteria bacterium GW2011_GWB1_37_5 TaxID=1618742 RepID=A0A0G0H0U6_9BACT|nr:MAG: hypothetical protein US50_C0004G0016 [Candidatus Nomurabacteria bacterium GW2011_GWB1_37_5]